MTRSNLRIMAFASLLGGFAMFTVRANQIFGDDAPLFGFGLWILSAVLATMANRPDQRQGVIIRVFRRY